MEPAPAGPAAAMDVDKLTYEIFSILESKFLFGYDDPKLLFAGGSPHTPPAAAKDTPPRVQAGKVCILSIDGAAFRKVFGDLTLRDTARPVLVPCYDLATGGPFLFSRADAVENPAYDFRLRDVCAATCAGSDRSSSAVEVRSCDGSTRIVAVGGGVALGNPTAAAITHVLNNKREFPFAAGAGDLVVLSLGGNAAAGTGARASSSSLLRIAGACQADMVDQAVAMAFGESRATNYVRIQGNGITAGATAEAAMAERGVESVLFRGKKLMPQTNGERLDGVAEQLVREQHRRMDSKTPVVLIKPSATPRTSSSSASTLITVSTNSSSESP